jgi:hypothetical protein
MKKNILGFLLLLAGTSCFAQVEPLGLENIIVEPYYVSDGNDDVYDDTDNGKLVPGSITYRIYVDMLPGYKFQSLYGCQATPTSGLHELKITTTTAFFNNMDRGAKTPAAVTANQWKQNTIALDSWFSVGGVTTTTVGVLKEEDTNGSLGNTNNLIQNTSSVAGIPVKTKDGMILGTPNTVTFIGLTTELDVFDAENLKGNSFITSDGAISSLTPDPNGGPGGTAGPTLENRVLIGQFTTNGTFSFELNIQIGTPGGASQYFVAKDPILTISGIQENSIPSLIYSSLTLDVPAKTAKEGNALKVYPNPSKDSFIIDINPSKESAVNEIVIRSLDGKEVMRKNLGKINARHTESIDISALSKGMYLVEWWNDGVKNTQKVAVQ